MKTQQELQLHYWGPHYDMVKEYNAKHGCDVKPWECVLCAELPFGDHPFFDGTASYKFAITILYDDKRKEHRPVFVGSTIYCRGNRKGEYVVSNDGATRDDGQGYSVDLIQDYLSWNPPAPKRTFKIGDKELPCPKRENQGGYHTFVCGEPFLFDTLEDCAEFKTKLIALITAARDKE